MHWPYRLQTRLGLTAPEGTAALVLLGLLTAGVVVRHIQATAEPLPADVYAAADAAFATASAVPPDSVTADVPSALALFSDPEAGTGGASDSTAAEVAEAEVEAAAGPRSAAKPPPVRTNINTASEQDLQRLPRIGPALAGRIIEYRRVHGPFRSADQITEVKGIGEKTLEKLRPWIYI